MSYLHVFQIFGLFLFLLGLSSIINKNIYKKILESFASSYGLFFLTWLLVLFLGYLMVTFYNIWEWKLTVIVTILWWMSIIKGAFMVAFPEWTMTLTKKIIKINCIMSFFWYPVIVLWLILLYLGYFNV